MSDRSTDHTKPLNMYLGERCHFSIRFLSTYRDGDGEVAPVVATPCQGQSESSLHKGAPSCGALGVAGLVHWAWCIWCIGRGWSGALGVAGLVHWAWLVWCIGRGWSGALGVAGLVHWAWLVWCIGRGWSGALGVVHLVHWAWLVWCIGRGWSGAHMPKL